MNKGITLNGMRIILFTSWGIWLEHRLFGFCSKCLLIRPEGGRSMKPICLLQLLRLGVIVYDWLDIRWIKAYCNFGFDHFNMSWKNIGVWGLADCLMGNTGPFASGDWILPDLTIQGSMRLNSHLRTFPDTFYFSYATKRTTRIAGIEEEIYARCYDSWCSQRVHQCALKDPRCL